MQVRHRQIIRFRYRLPLLGLVGPIVFLLVQVSKSTTEAAPGPRPRPFFDSGYIGRWPSQFKKSAMTNVNVVLPPPADKKPDDDVDPEQEFPFRQSTTTLNTSENGHLTSKSKSTSTPTFVTNDHDRHLNFSSSGSRSLNETSDVPEDVAAAAEFETFSSAEIETVTVAATVTNSTTPTTNRTSTATDLDDSVFLLYWDAVNQTLTESGDVDSGYSFVFDQPTKTYVVQEYEKFKRRRPAIHRLWYDSVIALIGLGAVAFVLICTCLHFNGDLARERLIGNAQTHAQRNEPGDEGWKWMTSRSISTLTSTSTTSSEPLGATATTDSSQTSSPNLYTISSVPILRA